uniref:GPN-loop GTPase 2 n=1 Tax=Leptocylindrus danicus TaxID=163516 RepID=A0A7S2PRX1_9STRA
MRELLDYLDDPAPGTNTNTNSSSEDGGVYSGHHCSSSWADDDEYQRARQKVRNGKFHRKHRKLHSELCDIIEDFSLVSFLPLNIQDAESVGRVVARIDKANGYVFGLNELKNQEKQSNNNVSHLFQCAAQADDGEWMFEQALSVQERYMDEALLGTTSAENSKQVSP